MDGYGIRVKQIRAEADRVSHNVLPLSTARAVRLHLEAEPVSPTTRVLS